VLLFSIKTPERDLWKELNFESVSLLDYGSLSHMYYITSTVETLYQTADSMLLINNQTLSSFLLAGQVFQLYLQILWSFFQTMFLLNWLF